MTVRPIWTSASIGFSRKSKCVSVILIEVTITGSTRVMPQMKISRG